MKRYQEYMDGVTVSDTLHEKLTGLTAPKKAATWKKYGAMAAALALVLGLGGMGLSRLGVGMPPADQPGIRENGPVIDIAPAGPDDAMVDDGSDIGGGYEVTDGRTAAYYALPAIIYNEQTGETPGDYALAPPGALSRSATLDDVAAMVGSQEVMKLHLLWGGGLSWSGTVWFLEDGTPCAISLWAQGDGVEFGIEMMAGSEVPSCVVNPDECYETTTFNGVEITALKNTGYAVVDGVEMREKRELSCFADGVGYKLTIYGVDGNEVEDMCARFTRWAIVEGFDLTALSADGAVPFAF